jgi:cytochrome P450
LFSDWSEDDLVAQAVIFILGGLDTLSTAMTFALHELAINSEVQDRLVQEIKEYHEKNNGVLDFDTLQNMTYMDMVVSGMILVTQV